LQESDIITKINSQKISDIKLFQKTIKDNANKEIILEIQRNDNLKEIKITPSKD
jgi:S1-C subfamily serine protease